MSLVDRKRGRPEGHSMLDDGREEIIRSTIHAFFLTRNRPTVSELVRKVGENASRPHRRTVVARLKDIDLQMRARRRGESKIAKSTEAVPGSLSPSRPLELVQIDHTRADIFVVDEETRHDRAGPGMLPMLQSHTMGDNRTRFGDLADKAMAHARKPRPFLQWQLS